MPTFLHISDTHISGDADYCPPWETTPPPHPNAGVERLLAAITGLPFAFDFILHTGDVCADPLAENYRAARQLLLRFPTPMYLLPGNHDSAEMMRDLLHDGRELHALGDERLELGDCQLVTLDTNDPGDPHAPTLSDDRVDAFAQRMAATDGQPTIVAAHHPLIETGVPYLDDEMRVQNGERIHQILLEYRSQLAGVFYGHIHQSTATQSDGIMYLSCQSTWTNLAAYPGLLRNPEKDELTPGGFNLVMLRGSRSFIRRYHLPA